VWTCTVGECDDAACGGGDGTVDELVLFDWRLTGLSAVLRRGFVGGGETLLNRGERCRGCGGKVEDEAEEVNAVVNDVDGDDTVGADDDETPDDDVIGDEMTALATDSPDALMDVLVVPRSVVYALMDTVDSDCEIVVDGWCTHVVGVCKHATISSEIEEHVSVADGEGGGKFVDRLDDDVDAGTLNVCCSTMDDGVAEAIEEVVE
jgi:hypothetical protein